MKKDRKKHKYSNTLPIIRLNLAVEYLLNKHLIKKQNELVNSKFGVDDEIQLSNLLGGVYKNIPEKFTEYLENNYDISSEWLNGKSGCMLNSLKDELRIFNKLIKDWRILYKNTLKITTKDMIYDNKDHLLAITISEDLINLLEAIDRKRELIPTYDEEKQQCCISDLFTTSKENEYVLVPIDKLPFYITLDRSKSLPRSKTIDKLFNRIKVVKEKPKINKKTKTNIKSKNNKKSKKHKSIIKKKISK